MVLFTGDKGGLMAANLTNNGDGTLTVAFTYTAASQRVQDTLGDCAHYLWSHGKGDHGTEEEPISFDDLTSAQKLALVDQHVKRVIIDAAHAYHSNAAQDAARATAEAEKETRYI